MTLRNPRTTGLDLQKCKVLRDDLDVSTDDTREDNGPYGPALAHYLEAEWASRGTSRPDFGKKVTFADSQFTNWAKGRMPRLSALREIADALGISAVKVLHGMGFLTDDEAREVGPPNIDEAIERDPSLTDDMRAALRAMRALGSEGKNIEVAKQRGKKR